MTISAKGKSVNFEVLSIKESISATPIVPDSEEVAVVSPQPSEPVKKPKSVKTQTKQTKAKGGK